MEQISVQLKKHHGVFSAFSAVFLGVYFKKCPRGQELFIHSQLSQQMQRLFGEQTKSMQICNSFPVSLHLSSSSPGMWRVGNFHPLLLWVKRKASQVIFGWLHHYRAYYLCIQVYPQIKIRNNSNTLLSWKLYSDLGTSLAETVLSFNIFLILDLVCQPLRE